MTALLGILIGLAAGVASGIFGIGGAVIIVPALLYFFKLTQHQAQGTTLLLMLPPIGVFAAIKYYMNGNAVIPIAVFVCLGFLVGGYIGASIVQPINDVLLRRMFAGLLILIAIKMMF